MSADAETGIDPYLKKGLHKSMPYYAVLGIDWHGNATDMPSVFLDHFHHYAKQCYFSGVSYRCVHGFKIPTQTNTEKGIVGYWLLKVPFATPFGTKNWRG